jgi:1-deoxy-D-xylulose-5-phosphate reductoisomerase
VLNAANEVAVDAFLAGRCLFPAIWNTVASVMESHAHETHPDLDAILAADAQARAHAAMLLAGA